MKGILTAGGQSRRMGRNKMWLMLGGRPLILHLYRVLAEVCDDIVIVVNDTDDAARLQELGLRTVRDVYAGQGPLAGLQAGLECGFPSLPGEEPVCLVGCDLPFLRSEVLRDLEAALTVDSSWQAAVSRHGGTVHPVCAVYRAEVREVAGELLQAGENRMRSFLERLRTRYVEASRWEREAFANLNTPEDYERACILWKKEGF
jgi:molybdopterin-guanine dinucleotide biosynthesis protein A